MVAIQYSDTYWFPDGTLAANVPARVFPLNSNALAPLWADAAQTIPIANPVNTDGAGLLTFYATAGDYWIHIDTETFEVSIPPAPAGPFLPLSGGTVTGNLGLVTGAESIDVGNAIADTLSTGVISGGSMSGLGTNQLSFGPMSGYIVDVTTNPANPSVQLVNMPAQVVPIVGVPATRTLNWWLCDAAGVISAQGTVPTEEERRNKIQIGATGSTIGTGILFNVQSAPIFLGQPVNQLTDLMYDLGPFSVSGNQLSPNGVNLMFNKSAGDMFAPSFGYPVNKKRPHHITSPAETPVTFRNSTRVSASQGPLTTVVDPGNYDVGGVITPVPGGTNTSTIQRVFLFGTGIAGAQLTLQYGQSFYASLSTALNNIGSGNYVMNPDYLGIGTIIGYIVVTKSATNLSDPTQAVFVRANKFASP